MTLDKRYIERLISQGEHIGQDFKFEIDDPGKIAKSLSAFANTEGGRLLIGVKDNGKISGIRSEEELYMIDAASAMHTEPQVNFRAVNHSVDGKIVLEIIVDRGTKPPYYAIGRDGRRRAYMRVADQNIEASPVHLELWRPVISDKNVLLQYSTIEQNLMNYLKNNEGITLNRFVKLASISRKKAVRTLALFIRFNLMEIRFVNGEFVYTLTETP